MSVLLRPGRNPHWASGRLLSEMLSTSLLKRNRATILPATESSEIPLYMPQSVLAPLFLKSATMVVSRSTAGNSSWSQIVIRTQGRCWRLLVRVLWISQWVCRPFQVLCRSAFGLLRSARLLHWAGGRDRLGCAGQGFRVGMFDQLRMTGGGAGWNVLAILHWNLFCLWWWWSHL